MNEGGTQEINVSMQLEKHVQAASLVMSQMLIAKDEL